MGKTYACTDLHGMYDLYQQIDDYIQKEDMIFCLGDCGDRGPDGWKIISSVACNPNWVYLKGNHEDMLANAILEEDDDYPEAYQLLSYNGGGKTHYDWGNDTSWNKGWGQHLKKLPFHYEYINKNGQQILLSHSGYNPTPEEERSKPYTENDFIWNRNHINTQFWCGADNQFIVHGHTPVALARKGARRPDLLRIENYCQGHKFNLDLASWYTGVACLLDLDTFEEHYFYTEPLKN